MSAWTLDEINNFFWWRFVQMSVFHIHNNAHLVDNSKIKCQMNEVQSAQLKLMSNEINLLIWIEIIFFSYLRSFLYCTIHVKILQTLFTITQNITSLFGTLRKTIFNVGGKAKRRVKHVLLKLLCVFVVIQENYLPLKMLSSATSID